MQHSLALLRTLRYSLYLSDDLLLWRETGWPHINANKNASCNGDHSIFPLFFFLSTDSRTSWSYEMTEQLAYSIL